MTAILWAVATVASLGLLAGLVLAVASALMTVPTDERVESLRNELPGANCGACGYSGCDGYAEAMAREEAPVGLCAPGGEKTAKKTAEILGVSEVAVRKKTAFVKCGGCEGATRRITEYYGLPSCAAAMQFYGGDRACSYGCLGYGDCASVCPNGAISIDKELASVDSDLCTACELCVKTCPKSLITIVPTEPTAIVRCSSREKGAVVRKACVKGCIGCMKCVKVCRYGAVTVQNNLAVVRSDKCTGCGSCVENCPVGCISFVAVSPDESGAR